MTRGWILTLGLSFALVIVIGAAFAFLAPEALPDKPVEEIEAEVDSGRVMDLEHLTEADLRFLEEVLDEGIPEARLSASRALVASGDARGAPILFARAKDGEEQDLLFCLAALEILRMQRFETAARTLILAEHGGLSSDCQNEVTQRLNVLSRDQSGVIILAEAPEPQVRRWVSYKLDLEQQADSQAVVLLAQDADLDVRRSAWLAIDAHGKPLGAPELMAWAAREPDPKLRARIEEVTERW